MREPRGSSIKRTQLGSCLGLPDLPIQYGDFTLWQREMGAGRSILAGESGLLDQAVATEGRTPLLALPTDRIRPLIATHHGAALFFDVVGVASTTGVKALARKEGATMFQVLLWRLSRFCCSDCHYVKTTSSSVLRFPDETRWKRKI